jgi:hypothetical protein
LERYGVDNPSKSEKIKNKIKRTNLENGVLITMLKQMNLKKKLKKLL